MIIIIMCLFPPWNVYSRRRETPWIDTLDDSSWGPYSPWDYWQSKITAATGATPNYEFFAGDNIKKAPNVERQLQRQTHSNPGNLYQFTEMEIMWELDISRFVLQLLLVLIAAAGLCILLRSKTTKPVMDEPKKLSWGKWGI